MHVIVLGAGLAGVTSAWYLVRAGHTVTVIDRQPDVALETSFANGGQISVSHPEPWANPRAPLQILRWLGREDAPLLFRPRADPRQWLWGLGFLRECLPARAARNTRAIAALAVYSLSCLQRLREELDLSYSHSQQGILHVFFSSREFAAAQSRIAELASYGIRVESVTPARCTELEPALAGCHEPLAGALYAPDDETGDAQAFVQQLAARCKREGVQFMFSREVVGLEIVGDEVRGARTVQHGQIQEIHGDAFLVALGSYSPRLSRSLGEALPIYPVKGYSVTLPLAPDACAPYVSITDESRRIVCSRLGDRLRVAGTAELNGYDTSIHTARCNAILRRVQRLLPRLVLAGEPQFWAGLRPATPSNVPVIGRSRYGNLFYNTGHGTLGWTLSCGSAAAIAELMSNRSPSLAFPFHIPRP